MANPNEYKVVFDTFAKPIYAQEVEMFKLNERYNFHKIYALRLWDLKERYTDEKINEIARLFSVSPLAVKEDIFEETYVNDNHRAFGKMHKDIMNQNTKTIYD